MIGKYIQSFYIVQTGNKLAQARQLCLIKGNARYNYMANPDRNIVLIQITGKCKDRF